MSNVSKRQKVDSKPAPADLHSDVLAADLPRPTHVENCSD